MQYCEKFSIEKQRVKSGFPMTMALLLKAKNNIGTHRHVSQQDHNDKYHHYKTRRKRKHKKGSQSEEEIIKRSTRKKKDTNYHRKSKKMNVGSRSNTATAATAKLGKNKRKDAEVKGANKKSKDETQAMEIEKTNDSQMIDDKEIKLKLTCEHSTSPTGC